MYFESQFQQSLYISRVIWLHSRKRVKPELMWDDKCSHKRIRWSDWYSLIESKLTDMALIKFFKFFVGFYHCHETYVPVLP